MRGRSYPTRLVRAFELSRESNFSEIASRGMEPRLVTGVISTMGETEDRGVAGEYR